MNWQWMTAASALAVLASTAGCAENPTTIARDTCGPGTVAEVPAYAWRAHHLVREGWTCGSLYSDGG